MSAHSIPYSLAPSIRRSSLTLHHPYTHRCVSVLVAPKLNLIHSVYVYYSSMLTDWYWYNVHEPNICPLTHTHCSESLLLLLLSFIFPFPIPIDLYTFHLHPQKLSFLIPNLAFIFLCSSSINILVVSLRVCYECVILVFIFMFILRRHPKLCSFSLRMWMCMFR